VKEIYDAANAKPFASPFLSQLAWDPLVARMLASKARRASYDGAHRESYLRIASG